MKKRLFPPLILTIFLILSLIQLATAEENESKGFFESLFSSDDSPAENNTAPPQENYQESTQERLSKHISLFKDNYQPKETLQAEITGNFISLKSENIFIYEESIVHPTPVIADLLYKDNKYYYYAILPDKEGNFSLRIQGAEYTDMGETKTEDIIKNFIIKKTDQTFLAIKPGFVIANKTFSITIQSPYKGVDIITSIEAIGETKTYSLQEYKEEVIEFSVLDINTTKTNLKISIDSLEYTIPIFVISEIKITKPKTNETESQINESGVEITENQTTEILHCTDIGKLCITNETCEGDTASSLEGPCCKGECVAETTSNAKPIIGVIILLIILGGLWILYSKAKKKPAPKSTEQILKEKSKTFNERMKNMSKEVMGKLGKN